MEISRLKTIAATAALSSFFLSVVSSALGFPDEPDETKTLTIKIIASPSILQPGTSCRIEVDDEPPTTYRTVVATYEGTVIEADDKGIRLDVRQVRRESAVPAASKVPFLNRLFRNTGIGRPGPGAKCPPVAIPAAKIRSVTILSASNGRATQAGTSGDSPPSP